MIKRFKVIKIVYAEDLADAAIKEKKTSPVEISLDEEIGDPNFKEKLIGFSDAKNGRK